MNQAYTDSADWVRFTLDDVGYERRGDFQQIWRDLHDRYFLPSEVKSEKVKKETQPFFEALIDEFFRRNWLMFHCLLISKQEVNLS